MNHTRLLRLRTLSAALLLMAGAAIAEQGARYLIIAADSYTGIVQPLADWKTKKGMLAKVVPVSQIGSSPSVIQAYIRNAYNTWPVKPEFVLLAGSPSQIESYGGQNDCYYGDMGGTQLMEISVGRFPAENARECSTMVAKTLAYERPSMAVDTNWYLKGTTTVNDDNPPDPYYEADSRLVRGWWQGIGYALCESLSDTRGHSSTHVNAAAADGRTFITHRGQCVGAWWSPFNNITPNSWNNGAKLPIVVSGSCATVSLEPGGSNYYGNSFVRAGTPQALGGAVAYFGTTYTGSHVSDKRSACFRGFFQSLFPEKQYRLGPATIRGRARVDSLFPGQWQWYWEWNLMGDPELNVWTSRPKWPAVTYDSVVPMAPQVLTVTVYANGSPMSGALVCAWLDSVVYATGTTNGAGQADLSINPTHPGIMCIVATGSNLRPFEGTCRVMLVNQPYVVRVGMTVDDYIGNHDGIVNPGEQFRLTVALKNVGGAAAEGAVAVYRTSAPGVIVSDSTSDYGTILPDSTAAGDPFDIAVDSTCGEGQTVDAVLRVTDSQGDSWLLPVNLVIRAGRLRFVSAALLDSTPGGNGNGRLGRGESGRLRLSLANCGGGLLQSVVVAVACPDPNVTMTDSTSWYGTAAAGETLAGGRDRFGVTAGPSLPKSVPVRFMVRVLADGGTYRYSDTFSFLIQAEQGTTNEPTGPDAYGYWCYDDTDIPSGRAPGYDWFELAPPGPGQFIPAVSDSDAGLATLPMPFRFKYYGMTDTFMSICSNGFFVLGYTTYRSGYNRPIPDTSGPGLLIAPFWDDLNPNESQSGNGTAYQYNDTLNHRWFVEFKEYAHYNQSPNIRETFQALFYDPAYYPTPTGDGEIVFLYNRVQLNSGCTVGIEDNTETRGIQYLYNNTYAPTAPTLQAARAIKFTTLPPLGANQPWLVLSQLLVSDSLYGNNNGVAEPGELLTIVANVHNSGVTGAMNTHATLRAQDGEGTVADSLALLGAIPVDSMVSNAMQPFTYRVAQTPSDSIAELALVLTADEYATVCYTSFGLTSLQAIETPREPLVLVTGLERMKPNPLVKDGLLGYSLRRGGSVDLALFDAAGRRVRTLVRGSQSAGRYCVRVSAANLSQGVYFCRLLAGTGTGTERFIRKVQVVR